jgi:hypothetical protein
LGYGQHIAARHQNDRTKRKEGTGRRRENPRGWFHHARDDMNSGMQSKVLIAHGLIALLITGCATQTPETYRPDKQPVPSVTVRTSASSPAPQTAIRARPVAASATHTKTSPAPATDIIALISTKATWIKPGRSLAVTRGNSGQPVPLFRQAIVLAEVRAALAGTQARPQTEIRRGQLTLIFSQGTTTQIADAINRTISIPEVQKLTVILPG